MSDNQNSRKVLLRRASEIRDDVPEWAWEYDDRGRIALGTVSLWAGRPGAGKSTGARWLAAQVTAGSLPGCWLGTPGNVGYIAREEHVGYVVKPSLRAHGADLDRVFFPEVVITTEADGEEIRPVAVADMDDLTAQFVAAGVRVVIVDPLMALAKASVDINRNNEVRELVEPWRHLAETINGVVIGVAHLNKSGNGDIVAGINGSSAFGEVARSVFGFAKDPSADDGSRVMSQEKNSLGDETLALRYRIDSATVTTDSGKSSEMGRFVILGDSDKSVGDVLRDAGRDREPEADTERDTARAWLDTYLRAHPEVDSAEAKTDGRNAGFSERTLQRARADLGTIITPNGRKSTWSLPVPTPALHVEVGTGGTSGTGQETAGQTASDEPMPPVPPVPRVYAREQPPGETPPGGITPTTPGMTDRVRQILNGKAAQ